MNVDGDGSGQAMAMLAELDGLLVAQLDDAGRASPFGPARRPASDLAQVSAAALQRRIGAPRGAARWTPSAVEDVAVAPAVDGERRRKVHARRTGSRSVQPTPTDVSDGRPSRVRDPEHHCFSGHLSVTLGPFGDLDPIGEFAEAMSSIPGVGSVRIRTFDRSSVVFDVDLTEPTPVIAQLRGRSYRPLRLLHANERIIRLKLV